MPMFKNVMVVFDDTAKAPLALKVAADVAKTYDATLHICHVNQVDTTLAVHAMNEPPLQDVLKDSGNRVIDIAVDYMEKDSSIAKCKYETHLLNGTNVTNTLVRYAKKKDMDLAVIASRGMGLIRQIAGSVSHELVTELECPCLIVK